MLGEPVVRQLLDDLRGEQTRGRLVQGGISFRTICAECNENRLGREYDSELKRLCADPEQAASATRDLRIALPNPVRLTDLAEAQPPTATPPPVALSMVRSSSVETSTP